MFFKTPLASLLLLSQLTNAAAVVQNSARNVSPSRRQTTIPSLYATCPTGGTFLPAPLFIIYLAFTIDGDEGTESPQTSYWVYEIQDDSTCAFYAANDGSYALTGNAGENGSCTLSNGEAKGVYELVGDLGYKYEANIKIGGVLDLCTTDATFEFGNLLIFDLPSGAGNLDSITTSQCTSQACHNTVIH